MKMSKDQNPVEPDPEDPTQIPMFDPNADIIDLDDEDDDVDWDDDEAYADEDEDDIA